MNRGNHTGVGVLLQLRKKEKCEQDETNTAGCKSDSFAFNPHLVYEVKLTTQVERFIDFVEIYGGGKHLQNVSLQLEQQHRV